jgi:Nif-specific regulatory protein
MVTAMGYSHKQAVFDVIRRVSSERELVPLINLLTSEIKDLLDADLVSVFLFDREKCELSSFVSLDTQKICFDARLGIAGAAALRGETINVTDAYEHPLFYREVDSQTGYRTRTVLAVPIKNRREEVIGVCEAINKLEGVFSPDDAEVLETFAAHAANAIETALVIDTLKKGEGAGDRKGKSSQKLEIGQSHLHNIVGMSAPIQAIVRLIDQIRDSSVDVLIQGESGTGKELVVRALHYNSPRYNQPFVALNCAALPDNLVESELYGIDKGVATGVDRRIGKFEAANGGTLFLDEIGDLSLSAQAKLLRVLQERAVDRVGGVKPIPVDVRIIAATNKNLDLAIKDGSFRPDLYYRLRVVRIQMPALREIAEDIPLLAAHFLARHCTLLNVEPKQFSREAMDWLSSHPWPGNARQLENEIKRLVASVRGKTIGESQLDLPAESAAERPQEEARPRGKTIAEVVEEIERRMIGQALEKYHWNKQKAAQELGLSRQGLIKKLKRLAITR